MSRAITSIKGEGGGGVDQQEQPLTGQPGTEEGVDSEKAIHSERKPKISFRNGYSIR